MRRALAVIGSVLGCLGLLGGLLLGNDAAPAATKAPPPSAGIGAIGAPLAGKALRYQRLGDPARTVVRRGSAGPVVAVLTDGARTAVLAGTARTFADPRFTAATVRSTVRVRLLPQAWTRGSETKPWFRRWLDRTSASPALDALAVSAQYLDGQPAVRDAAGIRYRGDASFGPDSASSPYAREEASDFYDYLGRNWRFAEGGPAEAETRRYGAVDCSGFVRLVYGYRLGLPLANVNRRVSGLPRRAYALAGFAAGTVVVPNKGVRATGYDRLQPGDLVFFDISGDPQIDHVGIYLGKDSGGRHRFVSSRGRADGPTLGDLGGTSLLDDGGYYSRAFRTAKRL